MPDSQIAAKIVIQGEITQDGQLKVELPPGLPPGKVEVVIRAPEEPQKTGTLGDLLELFGLWADRGIEDSVEYSRQLKHRLFKRDTE